MAKSLFQILFSFILERKRKKNLSPIFGMMVFFLDLVDFQSTGSRDFSSLFFDKRPLNVRSPCRECLLFRRLRDMVLVSGQNEVLLLLLSVF